MKNYCLGEGKMDYRGVFVPLKYEAIDSGLVKIRVNIQYYLTAIDGHRSQCST